MIDREPLKCAPNPRRQREQAGLRHQEARSDHVLTLASLASRAGTAQNRPLRASIWGIPAKVFGIGLSKTGTTTLSEALQILGYSAVHYPIGLRGVEESDAATDTPIADTFEMLDRTYPGSKFIYTVRQRDDWLRSCKTHWARPGDPREEAKELNQRLYGSAEFDGELFAKAYDRHEKRVLDYFENRPDDLLMINLCSGNDEWAALCSFLGKKVPDCPFPHGNKTKSDFEHYFDNIEWLPAGVKKQIRRIRRKTARIVLPRSRRHP